MAAAAVSDPDFPCSIDLRIPLPTARLANTALQALQVDPELSPLVRRHLSVVPQQQEQQQQQQQQGEDPAKEQNQSQASHVLLVQYRAATNRMLRVAVNSFMDSLKLVLEVMEQLDVDVLAQSSLAVAESGHATIKT